MSATAIGAAVRRRKIGVIAGTDITRPGETPGVVRKAARSAPMKHGTE